MTDKSLALEISRLKDENKKLQERIYKYENIFMSLEEELREKKHFIQNIVTNTPAILYIFDVIENKLIYVNNEINKS